MIDILIGLQTHKKCIDVSEWPIESFEHTFASASDVSTLFTLRVLPQH